MKLSVILLFAPVIAMLVAADDEPAVFTVEQVFATIVDTPPFMVEVTETRIWTQSPSIAPTTTTVAPLPSLDSAYNDL
ncbi:hypothetical protein CVT24_002443 [Panaeolus cyanescens]|uniref:Uncharacterized protein n=1 Tax=Panaeolus cyanescens TaxID=181874 RepID=A0A409WV85_9AGAR|nr:hypothetical protein CVT24_002443 [Panaeolus cyanescens]